MAVGKAGHKQLKPEIMRKLCVTAVALLLIVSCSKITTLNSYNDGPYVFYTDQKAGIITFNRSLDPDTAYFDLKKLPTVRLISFFDSLPCPPLEFRIKTLHPEPEGEYDIPSKLFAVSDIEGNFEKFYKLLLANEVIDVNYNWTFGDGYLVIVGDLVDRGDYAIQCQWLVYRLEEEALKAGGKVVYIHGNHDRMVLIGDDRYVSEKYDSVYEKLGTNVAEIYSEATELGRWMRTKNGIAKAGSIVFVHGGLSHELLEKNLSLSEINSIVRQYVDVDDPQSENSEFLFGRYGIFWYRGLIRDYGEYEKIAEDKLDEILERYSAEAIVVGHCIVDSVTTDFSGKVIRIDVDHYDKAEGLLIENGLYFAADEYGNKRRIE
jgi:hypothetical protein